MEKKEKLLPQLLAYAGNRKVLTYLSMVVAGISQLLALAPFLYIWAILRDVIAGDYNKALDSMSNEAVEYVRGIPVVKTFGQSVFSFKVHSHLSHYNIQHHHQRKAQCKANGTQVRVLAFGSLRNQFFNDHVKHGSGGEGQKIRHKRRYG